MTKWRVRASAPPSTATRAVRDTGTHRAHVRDGADARLGVGVHRGLAHAEVRHLERQELVARRQRGHVQQAVFVLEVAVHDAVLVAVCYRRDKLLKEIDGERPALRVRAGPPEERDRALGGVLEDADEELRSVEDTLEADDEGVAKLAVQRQLALDVLAQPLHVADVAVTQRGGDGGRDRCE